MSSPGNNLLGRRIACRAVESHRRQFGTSWFVSRDQITGAAVFQGVINVRAEEDVTLAMVAVSPTRIRTCREVAPLLGTFPFKTKRTVADGAHGQHAVWLTYHGFSGECRVKRGARPLQAEVSQPRHSGSFPGSNHCSRFAFSRVMKCA